MATKSIKKTNSVKATDENISSTEEVKVQKNAKKLAKKFDPTDVVECESVFGGELILNGSKSGNHYVWSTYGDITEVEYRDLVSMVRSASNYINAPYIIIRDDDFLDEFPKLQDTYNSMYSVSDLRDILKNTSVSQMKAAINSLPNGMKKSLLNIASEMISSGQFDSVGKIKVLDEMFGTKLMLLTGLFDE